MTWNSDINIFSSNRFSLFSLPSWISALLGPEPKSLYCNYIMYQYFIVSMVITGSIYFLAPDYRNMGGALSFVHIVLLTIFTISYRKLVVIDRFVVDRTFTQRIMVHFLSLLFHGLLFFFFLAISAHPGLENQVALSMVGAIWVVLRVVMRSDRRAHAR